MRGECAMEIKDWLILLIPILFNGSVIFILQKRFEKRHFRNEIKREHIRNLLDKVNKSLELFLDLSSDLNILQSNKKHVEKFNKKYTQVCESNAEVYRYLDSNESTFKFLTNSMEVFKESAKEMANGNKVASTLFEKIEATLKEIKVKCENQNI